jgi:hypothetical protein
MAQIIEITPDVVRQSPLYHNHSNQLRRAIGKFTVVYCGGLAGGTVRDEDGECWDWWFTEEVIPGTKFRKIRIIPAT